MLLGDEIEGVERVEGEGRVFEGLSMSETRDIVGLLGGGRGGGASRFGRGGGEHSSLGS